MFNLPFPTEAEIAVATERREKWKYLTEGVEDEHIMTNLEILLENMSKPGLVYPSQANSAIATEQNTTADISAFTTFALPLVRRVYPRLFANELFTVQPMTQPTGKVFYLDWKDAVTGTSNYKRNNLGRTFAADPGECAAITSLYMEISDEDITCETKKLRSQASLETMQDVNAYHKLDFTKEALKAIADELIREIDQLLLYNAHVNAGAGNVNWNSNYTTAGATTPSERRAHDYTLVDSIVDASDLIFQARYREANFIVGHPTAIKRLRKLGTEHYITNPKTDDVETLGLQKDGVLDGRYTVYKAAWYHTDECFLVGYKGKSWLEAGLVYSPYVPLYVGDQWVDPSTLCVQRPFMSRYGITMVNSGYYATVCITDS